MTEVLKVLLEIKQEIKESLLLNNKEVFSLKEFCSYADISEDYGYKLTSERKIKFYRPGGKKIYISRNDAINYLLQNPVKSQAAIEEAVNNYLLLTKAAA
jgi:excisionase family DNA binding protein